VKFLLHRVIISCLLACSVGCDLLSDPDEDLDGDGSPSTEDCDDNDPNIHPGAPELCDDIDSDCDGETDDPHAIDAGPYHPDRDSDGRGDPAGKMTSCTQPEGYVVDGTDCDDSTPRVSPDVAEVCDQVDNDCNGQTDEAGARNAPTWHADLDGDGHGDPSSPGTTACSGPEGHADNDTDCDDSNPAIHPDATEVWYDGVDQDCDGWSDFDQDRDGSDSLDSGGLDCNDDDGAVHPDAEEVCDDGIDNDCDGSPNSCGMHGRLTTARATLKITGEGARDQTGAALLSAGDLNGDGEMDLLIDAPFSDMGGDNAGAVYVLHGPLSTGELGVESSGVVLFGEAADDQLGAAMLSSSDLSGDGQPDLVLSSISNTTGGAASGSIYIVHGPFEGAISMADADARLWGPRDGMYLGYAMQLVPDVDGDGLDDLAVSAPLDLSGAGQVAIVSGASTGDLGLESARVAGMTGTSPSDGLGASLAAVDLDSDGVPELLIGAPDRQAADLTRPGAVYQGTGLLPDSPEDSDTIFHGIEHQSRFGHSITPAGDLDGDGHNDVLIGAPGSDEGADNAGAVYLFLGTGLGDISATDASAVFLGSSEDDALGEVVSQAGDLDGDGILDIVLGIPIHSSEGASSPQSGLVVILPGDVRGVVDVSLGAEGWVEGASAGDEAGTSITSIGDADGDGIDDLILGAPYEDSAGPNAGAVFLLAGGGI
jgi:hypothetical protein